MLRNTPLVSLPHAASSFVQSVLDGLGAHVCVLDEHGRILAVNRAWRDFAQHNGANGDQVCEGADYLAVCLRAAGDTGARGPDDQATARSCAEALQDILAGRRQHFQLEYPCDAPDRPRWFVVRISRADTGRGGPVRAVVAHDDITLYRSAQAALRRREALLLDLAASIPGAMFRLLQPVQGPWRFTYLSPGIEDLLELSPTQACIDARALTRLVDSRDQAALDASIQQAFAGRRGWAHEYRVHTAHTARLKWVRAVAQPSATTDGSGAVNWTGVMTDVTEQHLVQQALADSETTYRTLFETVPQGVVYHAPDGQITGANPAAQRILGLTLDQLQGRQSMDPRWQAVRENGTPFPGEEHPAMVALRTGQPVHGVVMGLQVPGRGQAWIRVSAIPLFRHGLLHQAYASFEDITEQLQLRDELRTQATTDALTGVANRRSLMDHLATEFAHAQRHPDRPFTVLALDIDLFKQVNDTYGHAAGDDALRHVARLMQQQTRPHDLVGRSGGEEFMLLLRDADRDAAQPLAERLRLAIAQQPLPHEGRAIALSVSIGVATVRTTDATPDAVLSRADRALYAAKHGGRNQVQVAPD